MDLSTHGQGAVVSTYDVVILFYCAFPQRVVLATSQGGTTTSALLGKVLL